MGDIVHTFEDRIPNTILTAFDNIITPRLELAVRSENASSERDAAIVTAILEHGEHIGISPPFRERIRKKNTLYEINAKDDIRGNNPDEATELSVQGTHSDLQLWCVSSSSESFRLLV